MTSEEIETMARTFGLKFSPHELSDLQTHMPELASIRRSVRPGGRPLTAEPAHGFSSRTEVP